VAQQTTAVGRCRAPTPTDIQLVNLPIEADVGYPVGCVTKEVDLLLTEPTNREGYLF